MAKLNSAMRRALKPSQFALPGKKAFPINDENHGRAALSMAHNASPSEQATIREKVASKFPGIKQTRPGKRAMMGKKASSK
jgi:hypothetical protein